MIYSTKELIERLQLLDEKYPDYDVYVVKDSNNKPRSRNNGLEIIGQRVDMKNKELYLLV